METHRPNGSDERAPMRPLLFLVLSESLLGESRATVRAQVILDALVAVEEASLPNTSINAKTGE